jgi:tetratricopeptide (TPR) repeat protein
MLRMSKGVDVYQPCPCGSGKKIKFCCATVIDDMLDVFDLMGDGKFVAAKNVVELPRKRAEAAGGQTLAWVLSVHGSIEVSLGNFDAAAPLAEAAIAANPEYPDAHLLKSIVLLAKDDFDGARKSFDAGFRHVTQVPAMAMEALIRMAGVFAERKNFMAVRSCLSAMFYCSGKTEEALQQLRDFDHNRRVPYPLRANISLRPVPKDVPWEATAREGVEMHLRMAFYSAAEKFKEVVEKVNDSGMFFNLGLSLGKIGNDRQAALALRRSALLDEDYERAVETEALAQLLELLTVLPREESVHTEYRIESFDALDAKLDSLPRCAHVELAADPRTGALPPVVRYALLDRAPTPEDLDRPFRDQPRVCGEISIFRQNAVGEKQPLAFYTEFAHIGDRSMKAWLEAECGGLISPSGNVRREPVAALELATLNDVPHLSGEASYPVQERWRDEEFVWLRDEIWPSLKLTALGGRTLNEARERPELKIPLAASLIVLETYLVTRGGMLDENLMRERYGLPPVAPLVATVEAGQALVWSTMQARRGEMSSLSDENLSRLMMSLAGLSIPRVDVALFGEQIARIRKASQPCPANVFSMYARALYMCGRRDEALAIMEQARGAATNFREHVDVDMLEVSMRSNNPADPQLELIAYRIWQQYAPKLPQEREFLEAFLCNYLPKGPWAGGLDLSGSVSIPEAGAVSSGGIWTPESASAAAPGGGGKLWVPGS